MIDRAGIITLPPGPRGATMVGRSADDVGRGDPLEPDSALLLAARAAPTPAERSAAFRVIYERHHGPVRGFLGRLMNDAALADEVLQEVFLRAFRAADGFEPGAPLRPWLFRIARNAALNALRAEGKVPVSGALATEPPARAAGPPEAASLADEVSRLRAALLLVPAETRALLVLHHHVGLRPVELAASYGCTERTIRNRLHAASQAVAVALGAPASPERETS